MTRWARVVWQRLWGRIGTPLHAGTGCDEPVGAAPGVATRLQVAEAELRFKQTELDRCKALLLRRTQDLEQMREAAGIPGLTPAEIERLALLAEHGGELARAVIGLLLDAQDVHLADLQQWQRRKRSALTRWTYCQTDSISGEEREILLREIEAAQAER